MNRALRTFGYIIFVPPMVILGALFVVVATLLFVITRLGDVHEETMESKTRITDDELARWYGHDG